MALMPTVHDLPIIYAPCTVGDEILSRQIQQDMDFAHYRLELDVKAFVAFFTEEFGAEIFSFIESFTDPEFFTVDLILL